MSNKQDLIEKLMKIKNLSSEGVEGEKETARRFLEKLMKKYDVTEEELNGETAKETRWFKYRSGKPYHRDLIYQIIYSVVGNRTTYKVGQKCVAGVDCDKVEAVEIEAKYNFYSKSFEKDLNLFYTAFVNKNNIFPPDSVFSQKEEDIEKTKSKKPEVDREKLFSMMGGMEKHEFFKQLE